MFEDAIVFPMWNFLFLFLLFFFSIVCSKMKGQKFKLGYTVVDTLSKQEYFEH